MFVRNQALIIVGVFTRTHELGHTEVLQTLVGGGFRFFLVFLGLFGTVVVFKIFVELSSERVNLVVLFLLHLLVIFIVFSFVRDIIWESFFTRWAIFAFFLLLVAQK